MKEPCRIEPFFISEEAEAELLAAGYVFEPPSHARTTSLPEILMGLTDDALAAWPNEMSSGEVMRRRHVTKAIAGALHGKN